MSTKTQRLVLDLEKNTDLADLVADAEPGDKLDAVISIVHRDEKSLTVELEEVSNSDGESTADTEDEDEDEGEVEDTPAMKMMRGRE